MIVKFDKEYLEELYLTGKCKDKHHRYQRDVVVKYARRIVTLKAAPTIEALYQLNSLHYEVLVGDQKGLSSIRIDERYRLEFIVSTGLEEPSITICTVTDISNHYQ